MGNSGWSLLGLVLSHGATMGITVYLAVLGGRWLDRRLGTEPLFMALLVVLVVAANLHLMIKDILERTERGDR